MAETYEYSKARAKPRRVRERIYLALSLAVIAAVIVHRIGSFVGWW